MDNGNIDNFFKKLSSASGREISLDASLERGALVQGLLRHDIEFTQDGVQVDPWLSSMESKVVGVRSSQTVDGKHVDSCSRSLLNSSSASDCTLKQPTDKSAMAEQVELSKQKALNSVGARLIMLRNGGGRSQVGLPNLGNTCYFNSILQCLTNCKPLYNYIRSGAHDPFLCRQGGDRCILCLLKKFCDSHLPVKSNVNVVHESALRDLLGKMRTAVRKWKIHAQQSADDIMRLVLDSMWDRDEAYCGVARVETPMMHLFGTIVEQQYSCSACGKPSISTMVEPMLILGLVNGDRRSVQDRLQMEYGRIETLSEPKSHCDACGRSKTPRPTVKRVLKDLPMILVVMLKRFFVVDGMSHKINHFIPFPEELDLRPFMDPSAITSQSCNGRNLSYSLTGLIEHRGQSTSNGHYVAYCRNVCPQRRSESWFYLNDRQVCSIAARDVLQRQAFLLFYTAKGQATRTVSIKSSATFAMSNGTITCKPQRLGPTKLSSLNSREGVAFAKPVIAAHKSQNGDVSAKDGSPTSPNKVENGAAVSFSACGNLNIAHPEVSSGKMCFGSATSGVIPHGTDDAVLGRNVHVATNSLLTPSKSLHLGVVKNHTLKQHRLLPTCLSKVPAARCVHDAASPNTQPNKISDATPLRPASNQVTGSDLASAKRMLRLENGLNSQLSSCKDSHSNSDKETRKLVVSVSVEAQNNDSNLAPRLESSLRDNQVVKGSSVQVGVMFKASTKHTRWKVDIPQVNAGLSESNGVEVGSSLVPYSASDDSSSGGDDVARHSSAASALPAINGTPSAGTWRVDKFKAASNLGLMQGGSNVFAAAGDLWCVTQDNMFFASERKGCLWRLSSKRKLEPCTTVNGHAALSNGDRVSHSLCQSVHSVEPVVAHELMAGASPNSHTLGDPENSQKVSGFDASLSATDSTVTVSQLPISSCDTQADLQEQDGLSYWGAPVAMDHLEIDAYNEDLDRGRQKRRKLSHARMPSWRSNGVWVNPFQRVQDSRYNKIRANGVDHALSRRRLPFAKNMHRVRRFMPSMRTARGRSIMCSSNRRD